MTTRPTVSIAQLDALEAAAEGNLSRSAEQHPHWRIDDGLAVTLTVRVLVDRGLLEEGPARGDGRIPAVLTVSGRELLEDFASREPGRKWPHADPS